MTVPADNVPEVTVQGSQRRAAVDAAPGESLNGVNPTDADPAVDRVWSLSSRPEATKKIW
jgi:hypothetical protein